MDKTRLVGMSSGGAAAMKRLAKLLKGEPAPDHTIFLLGHSNELLFKDASRESCLISDSETLCADSYALCGSNPKRIRLFEEIQQLL